MSFTTQLRIYSLLFVLIFVFQSNAQNIVPSIVQVSLKDQNNNPIPNYDVLIRPNAYDQVDEIIARTDANGYWSDTVGLYEDKFNAGFFYYSAFVLDSFSTGIGNFGTSRGTLIRAPYYVMDTIKFQLTNPIKYPDNCGGYSAWTDSVVNDPMFVSFKNDLNRVKTGITWVYGDGDTGHAPQSWHRYDTAGTYYYCHYTDSCGPVCDSVTVPTKVPTCVVNPIVWKINSTLQGADISIDHRYPSSVVDSVEWTFSGGIPSSNSSWYGLQFFPTGDYEYCVKINQCPVFCDSIHVNTDCESKFRITQTNPNGNVLLENISQPISGDSLEVNYFWDFGDGNTSNSKYPSNAYAVAGSYGVCLTIQVKDLTYNPAPLVCTSEYCKTIVGGNQSTGSGFTLNVLDPTVGFKEHITSQEFSLYPNPVENLLTAKSKGDPIVKVEIFDLVGNQLHTAINEDEIHLQRMRLNLAHLSPGIYLAIVHSEGGAKSTFKFIKK